MLAHPGLGVLTAAPALHGGAVLARPSPAPAPCEEEETSGCAPAGLLVKPNLDLISFSL